MDPCAPRVLPRLPDPVLLLAPDGLVADWNPAAAAAFSLKPRRRMRMSARDIAPDLEAVRRAVAGGREPAVVQSGPWRFALAPWGAPQAGGREASPRWIVAVASPAHPAPPDPLGAVLEPAGIGSALLDGDGRIVHVTPALECRLPLTAPGASARPWPDLVAEARRGQARAALERARSHGWAVWEGPLGDGTDSAEFLLVRGAQAGAVHLVLLPQDAVRRLDHAHMEFINTAAHELRTPLVPLKVQVHLLKTSLGGGLAAQQRTSLDVLDRNLARLHRLVEEILDSARLESGRLPIDRRPMDLADVAREALETFAPAADQLQIALESRLDGAVPVEGDHGRLVQVATNLLSNALKFTPRGGRVVIWVRREEGAAVLGVEDTGAGLTAAQAARLFRPFGRVHDAQRQVVPGTGLGLFITRGIMEAHGGAVEVSSPGPGRGSTFTVRLPTTGLSVPARDPAAVPADPVADRLRQLI